jgi:hypothetical protein
MGLTLLATPGRGWQKPASEGKKEDAASVQKKNDVGAILGTVFAPQGFALAGAKVEVRRTGESKARWRTQSDRRGEFSFRLPAGEYDMTIVAAGCTSVERKVSIVGGLREDFTFRMQVAKEAAEKKP